MSRYNHKAIENNWKDHWYKDNIYAAKDFSPKPKKYILAELPYPSGKYLHVGHAMRYTVPEIYSRFWRMKGFNVMFPLGWDSFGLPAEVFAIKEGITPEEAIAQAAKDYKRVTQNVGYGIDWSREINTSDPKYYKWTQWIFLKLWEAGLAEIKEMPVWWCKELGVLADEEIVTDANGNKVSEKGGHPVSRIMFKQWVLKIPKYADKLLEGLNNVDFPDAIKAATRSWIGKNTGVEVNFMVDDDKLTVFTTRPDTLFGVTFLAISPQHKIAQKLLSKATNKSAVEAYIAKAAQLTDIEKQTKEKTGVKLEGIHARHPLQEVDRQIPIFIADYILQDYGTGIVMGVPGHDERDLEFAKKMALETFEVIKDNKMQNSGQYDGRDPREFKKNIIERLEKEGTGRKTTTYKLRDQIWSRQRFWGDPIPLIHKSDGTVEADYNLPVVLPKMEKTKIVKGEALPPLSEFEDWANTTDSSSQPAKRETDTMPTWAGSNWYYLRYIDPSNDITFADMEKMKYWLPVDHYFGGSEHTTVHLLYSRFWYRFLYDNGLVPTKEPYAKRTNGGLLLGPDGFKMSKSRGNVLDPQEVIDNYGADVLRTYIAFIGPYEDTFPWNPTGVKSCYRLMNTIWELKSKVSTAPASPEITKANHILIRKVTHMCESCKMNTAVSEIMKFVNLLKKETAINVDIWKNFLKVLAPFAVFLAEELWQEINGYMTWQKENSVHLQDWPNYDEALAKETLTRIPVQVNGKLRDQLEVTGDENKDEIKEMVLNLDGIKRHIIGKYVKNVIYVSNRVVNVVVE